jgi:hypothetical protein
MIELWISPTRTMVCKQPTNEVRQGNYLKFQDPEFGQVYAFEENGKVWPLEAENDAVTAELALKTMEALCNEEKEGTRPNLVGYTPTLARALSHLNPRFFAGPNPFPWPDRKHTFEEAEEENRIFAEGPTVFQSFVGIKVNQMSNGVFLRKLDPFNGDTTIESIKNMRKQTSFAAWWIHEWSPFLNCLMMAFVIQTEIPPAQLLHKRQEFPKHFRKFEFELRKACRG